MLVREVDIETINSEAEFDELFQKEKILFIRDSLCGLFGISVGVFMDVSKKDGDHISYIRNMYYYLCKVKTQASWKMIAEVSGRKNHTTPFHGYKRCKEKIKDRDAVLFPYWNYFLKNAKPFLKP